MKRTVFGILFLLACAVVVQSWTGMLSHTTVSFRLDEGTRQTGIHRFRLPFSPHGCVRLWQDGKELSGPRRFLKEVETAGAGTYAIKDRNLYVFPLSANPETPGSAIVVQLPSPIPSMVVLLAFAYGIWLIARCAAPDASDVPSLPPPGKIEYLESLRGIACLMVCASHFIYAYYGALGDDSPVGRTGKWVVFSLSQSPLNFFIAGNFAVCVFFVLSGFVLALPFVGHTTKSSIDYQRAIVRRPLRLGGILLFAVVVSYLLWGTPFYQRSGLIATAGEKPSVREFLMDIFWSPFASSPKYDRPFWSIQVELYGSVALYFVVWWSQGRNWRWILYLVLALALHSTYYVGFVAGLAMADAFKVGLLPMRKAGAWWSLAALLLGAFLAGHHPDGATESPDSRYFESAYTWLPSLGENTLAGSYRLIAAVLVMYGVLSLRRLQAILNHGVLVEIGRLSYALYSLHAIVICSLVDTLFLWLFPAHLSSYWSAVALVFVVYVPAVWAFAWLGCRYVDAPSIRFSKRVAMLLFPPSNGASTNRN